MIRCGRAAVAALVGLTVLAACSSHGTHRPSPAAQYLTIADAGNDGLEEAFDALEGPDANDLPAARGDLRDAAATEHRFDQGLDAIGFPLAIEKTADALVRVNEARAALTTRAAGATSIRALRAYEKQLDAANDPVEDQVRLIRSQLGLPPPETS